MSFKRTSGTYKSLRQFEFGGATVLSAYRGRQVSFNTTAGDVLLKDNLWIQKLQEILILQTNLDSPLNFSCAQHRL